MSTNESKSYGAWGEKVALEYLTGNGYVFVAQGFRSRFGEIDLIVTDEMFIVFVEVKTRKSNVFAYACESVNKHKQKRIIATANSWLSYNRTEKQPRFDVIEVYANEGVNTICPGINHIANAF